MTHLILHRFGSKKIGNQIQPDFDIEETENNGKRQYIFSIELDENEIDVTTKKEKPNTSQRVKLKGKSAAQIKAQIQIKGKSKSVTTNGKRTEIFDYCDHCIDNIHAEINK
tara:strand:+ start:359 stop:691 length:333 start_codon:yes stop_codon:yes gene_type:complete